MSASKTEKLKALESAIGQIEKAFGKGSVMKLGQSDTVVDIEAVSTGSLGLDIALGIGGLPKGRIVEIYGPESSGKTTLALHAAVFMAITFVTFVGYGACAALARDYVISRPDVLKWIRRSFAGTFGLLGLRLALSDR